MDVQLTPAIRYWEMDAPRIATLLQELKSSGADCVGAWVPWDHVETDRRQTLRKFVKQSARFGLKIRLVVTPEVSVGYANGGIPEDLLRKSENLARDRTGQTIYSCAPPNIHPLVNLNAPQVFQRYGHFLLRLAQEIQEVVEEHFEARVELIVGDSFFKHYHTAGLPPEDHGDYSPLFFQRELDFMQGWTPAQAERTFCVRAVDFLAQRFERSSEVSVSGRCFYMKSASLDRLVDELAGAALDPAQTFEELQLARSRCDAAWFHDLSDVQGKERSFLVSSALAIYGDVWLPIDDYLETTPAFRKKMASLAASLSGEDSRYERPVLSIVQNRFAPARLAQALRKKLGGALQMRSSMFDLKPAEFRRVRMMVVEEALLIDYEQFQALVRRAREQGATIAMFRSSLCKRAQADVALFDKFKFSHGWKYDVTLFPSGGHIIVIEGHETANSSMETLAERLLAVGNIAGWCEYSDAAVASMAFELGAEEEKREKIIFFVNPSEEPRQLNIRFARGLKFEGMTFRQHESATPRDPLEGEELETTLPPLAVVPLRAYFPVEEQLEIGATGTAEEELDGPPEQLA